MVNNLASHANEIELHKLVRSRRCRSRVDLACVDCGVVRNVRTDAMAERCSKCASARNLAAAQAVLAPRFAALLPATCAKCGGPTSGRQYKHCVPCRRDAESINRECKACGGAFRVAVSVVHGPSNSSGNFCSRPCYERWLCDSRPEATMGARWRQHRRAAIKAAPFCAVCGTSKRLQVHHITPRRKGGGQEPSNLIPLCVGHHKTIEVMTVEALHACPDDLASAMEGVALRLRIRQSATAQVLARVRAAA